MLLVQLGTKKDGSMYILPECIVGMKHKWTEKDDKKNT